MKSHMWFDNSIDRYAVQITDDSGRCLYLATGTTPAIAEAFLRAKIEAAVRCGQEAKEALDCSYRT